MASRSTGGGTILASGIRTRERKERKLYSDDWALGDEEIEGHQTFDLDQKIKSDKFDSCFVKDMTASEYNLKHVQKHGFNWPLLFREKSQLGITIPSSEFTINDVRLCVGSRRMLDVMDVNTQKNVEMTMKDWQRYFESQDKDKLLNVISLEFSHTKLEQLVQAPTVVRQIDWVERVWPRHLKEAQTEATNVLEDMMYPKVQKYCLMSVGGCYTDFHIDFGGTSVWYHILRGKKIFWLIPPTERNFQLYEQWVLSGKQSDIFFGDTVDKCARIELTAGNTFFIPTGWIHAVYTPEDSLVFGGNFLHSFGIEKQLRVAQVEDATHVPQKFRYPFFTEMLWYVLERYVHVLLGRTHLSLPPDEEEKYKKYMSTKAKANNNNQLNEVKEEATKPEPDMTSDSETKENENENGEHVHLTQYELHGLKAIVMYLHALPTSKKCVPDLITDPIALIRDVRTVVEKHRYDIPEKSLTSKPVLEWWPRDPTRFGWKRPLTESTPGTIKKRRRNSDENRIIGYPPNVSKVRHRRVRCKLCEPCTRDDCRTCYFCLDMTKYGGPGTMKQSCKMKKCTQPMLPVAAACYECEFDGWGRVVTLPMQKPPPNVPNSLFECCVCFKVSHLKCLSNKFDDVDGIVNEDLPNSWECPECVKLGYNKDYKHNRVPSSRASTAGSDTGEVKTPSVLSDADDADVKVKLEPLDNGNELKKSDLSGGKIKEETVSIVDAAPPHMPTWEQLQARVSRPLVRPMWVVRPNPPPPDEEEEEEEDDEESGSDGESRPAAREPIPPPMNRSVMLPVFHHLSVKDLRVVMQVCRAWAQWAIHPSLWKSLRLTHKKINANHLMGVVRRQPHSLDLSWARITKEQLSWLLARLPQLQELHLEGQSWQTISCLTSPYCPALSVLNLSYCEGLTDATLTALLAPPRSHRPGHRDTTTRLKQLTELQLPGTQVGDEGVRSIVRSLPFLSTLNLSSCLHITELTAALLAHPSSVVSHSLSSLDLRGCHRLAPTCLPSLKCLPLLAKLALHPCSRIPLKALRVWGKHHGYTMVSEEVLTRAPPPPPDPTADTMYDSEVSSFSRSSSPVTASETKQITAVTSTRRDAKIEKDKNPNEGTQLKVDSALKSSVNEISVKPPKKEPSRANVSVEKTPEEKSEKGKRVGDKEGRKSNSSEKSADKGNDVQTGSGQKAETNSAVGSGIRVSTRRQSRLQEADSESGVNVPEAEKEKITSESCNKKETFAGRNEKNVTPGEPIGKKIRGSMQGLDNSKSNTAQEKQKEKCESKETSSTSIQAQKKGSKTIADEANKKEPNPVNTSTNEKCNQTAKKNVNPHEDSEKDIASPSQVSKNLKPVSVSLPKNEKSSSEKVLKIDKSSLRDNKSDKSLSEDNKSDKSSQESKNGRPSLQESKNGNQGINKSTTNASEQTNKKSLSQESVSTKDAVGLAKNQKDSTPSQKDSTSSQKDSTSSQKGSTSSQKDSTSSQKGSTSSQKDSTSSQKDSTSSQKDSTSSQEDNTSSQKDSTTSQKDSTTSQKDSTSSQKGSTSSQKDGTSSQKDGTSSQKDSTSSQKDGTSSQKEDTSSQKNGTTSQKDSTSSAEVSKKMHNSQTEQSCNPSTSSGPNKRKVESPDQSTKKRANTNSDDPNKKTEPSEPDKKKLNDKKGTSTSQASKTSDSQMNQKNLIVTSVEVHRADNYDSTQDCETSVKRPERRLSVRRRSKDEQELKSEEKQEKNEKVSSSESLRDKRRDSKSREEEMNRITIEDSSEKDSKHGTKRIEDKDKKASSSSKKLAAKQQSQQSPLKVKQEKDIVTRSTKRLKSEKEVEEKQAEQSKEESSPKLPEKCADVRKNYRKSKDVQDDKEDSVAETIEKDLKSPKPVSGKRDRESIGSKISEKKDDDKVTRRSRSDTEEYMSKLRRKSHDSDGSSDLPSADIAKKEESTEEKMRSRRRSVRDEETPKGALEKKLKEESKEEKKSDTCEGASKGIKNVGDNENTTKQTKRKYEDTEETDVVKKVKDEHEDGGKTGKKPPETLRERSGSRERPERAHRSPRRLSMCQ